MAKSSIEDPTLAKLFEEKMLIAAAYLAAFFVIALVLDIFFLRGLAVALVCVMAIIFAVQLRSLHYRMRTGKFGEREFERRDLDHWLKQQGGTVVNGMNLD